MKNKLIAVAVAGAFAVSSAAAFAEESGIGSFYILPTIGAMHADSDLDTDGTDAAYGIRLGKQISDHWDVQLGVTHSKADIDYRPGYSGEGEYKQTLIGVDALYMLSRDKFRPFLLAGLGMARNSIDTKDFFGNKVDEDKWSWMANVGLGAQYLFNDTVGLQADLRHVWSRAEAPRAPGATPLAAPDFTGDKTVGNTYLNVGLMINFGAPKKLAAAEPMMAMPEPAPAPVQESMLPEIAPYDEETYPFTIDEPEPEPEVGPAPPAFEKITLQAEVLFDFDKSMLKDEGKSILDVEVVEPMKAHPEVEVVLIAGHTDRIGSDNYNQALSERRAAAVKSYLESQGIASNRLNPVGKGEAEPVVDCKGIYGKAAVDCLQPNRRVVVEIEVQRIVE